MIFAAIACLIYFWRLLIFASTIATLVFGFLLVQSYMSYFHFDIWSTASISLICMSMFLALLAIRQSTQYSLQTITCQTENLVKMLPRINSWLVSRNLRQLLTAQKHCLTYCSLQLKTKENFFLLFRLWEERSLRGWWFIYWVDEQTCTRC